MSNNLDRINLSSISTTPFPGSKAASINQSPNVDDDFRNWIQHLSDEKKAVPGSTLQANEAGDGDGKLKQTFQDFVGQTMFSQLISSMRTTQREPAYFHGGQAEKIFQGQLDQVLTEEISKSSADSIAEPMYRLFQLQRR